ncbi:hypothetical protein JOM56_009764 [Amanita muscaria]
MQRPSPDLPADVWSIVASFLPPEELGSLYGVNPALFDLSMKERYWRVCFNGDKRTMKWLRKNIVRKHVQGYVRTVEIKPWQIEERAAKKSFWWSLFRLLTRESDEWSKRAEEHRKQRKIAKAIKRISDAVKELPNVREYTVQCPEGDCHPALVHGLLPSLTNWKDSLVKLTLCVPPDSLCCLAAVELNQLERLELVFWSKAPESFQYHVIEPLAVFINNLCTTLESLSVVATREATDVDLALLFKALGTFSRLSHFDLSMPYDGSSFSTTRPLLSFVDRHKGLRSLELSTKPAATRQSPTQLEHKEWIPRILDLLDSSFRNVQQVNVALRPLKAKSISDALIRFLSIHGHNLALLALTENAGLSLEEVQAILGATKHFYHLERLALNVQRVDEALFRLLATRFPRLKHLEIGFMYPPISLHSLREDLNKNREFYSEWGLKRIEISCKCCPGPMEALLKKCIPSLEVVACSQPKSSST